MQKKAKYYVIFLLVSFTTLSVSFAHQLGMWPISILFTYLYTALLAVKTNQRRPPVR